MNVSDKDYHNAAANRKMKTSIMSMDAFRTADSKACGFFPAVTLRLSDGDSWTFWGPNYVLLTIQPHDGEVFEETWCNINNVDKCLSRIYRPLHKTQEDPVGRLADASRSR